jgi:hypothetical protein
VDESIRQAQAALRYEAAVRRRVQCCACATARVPMHVLRIAEYLRL